MVSEIPDNCRLAVVQDGDLHGHQQEVSDSDRDSLKLELDLDRSRQQVDVVSIGSSYDEDDSYSYDNSLALSGGPENSPPSFGNIAVSNSSGIHVGNKNYYQGPVTIKKIVYAGAGGEADAYGAQNGVLGVSGKCDKEKDTDNANNCGIVDKKTEKDNFATHIRKLRYNKPLLITVCVCVSAIAIIGMGSLLFIFLRDNPTSNNVVNEPGGRPPTTDPLDPVDLPRDKVKLITRREWLAQAPTAPPDELPIPVPYIIIWHTATDNCTNQGSCMFMVKQIQNFHMQGQRWWDIAYNFLVGGDGYVYEGRGWTSEGSHTKFYNKMSIGIAFMGTFTSYMPPKRQLDAARNLIALGVNESYVQENYKLFAARQLSSTESPGEMLFEELMTWPHWTQKLEVANGTNA